MTEPPSRGKMSHGHAITEPVVFINRGQEN